MTPEIFFTYLPVVAILAGGYLLWRRFLPAGRRKIGSGALRDLQGRVAELEGELSSTNQELQELKEGQEFTERLLVERKEPGDETPTM